MFIEVTMLNRKFYVEFKFISIFYFTAESIYIFLKFSLFNITQSKRHIIARFLLDQYT